MHELTVPEAFLLLALNDEKGNITGSFYSQGLAGAALTELCLRGAIKANDDRKPKLHAVNTAPTGNTFLDECLQKIAGTKTPRPANGWVTKLTSIPKLVAKAAAPLCEAGILTEQKTKTLGIFPQTRWPEANPAPERTLKANMAAAMFGVETAEVDARTTALIALSKHCDLLPRNFDKARLRLHKDRITKISKGDMIAGQATADVISAVRTMIMVAAIMPAITTTTIVTG